jgi:hypothetical protein
MKQPAQLALRVILLINIILSGLFPVLAAPSINSDNFRYLGDVLPGPADTTGFFVLEIAPETYSSMDPTWRDLRIYNSAGQEIGYTPLLAKTPSQQSHYQESEIINKGPIKDTDKYSFTIKDLPADSEKLTIKLDKPEYLVKSEIYGSNDNQTWQLVGTQTLYGINGNYNLFSLRNVLYRYIKFEFMMPLGENLSVSSVQYSRKTPGKKSELPFSVAQSETNKSTVILVDLGYNHYHSRALKLTTTDKNFYRRATLEVSNGQEQWQQVSSFYLYRGVDMQDENLSVEYPLTQARYLKIILQNGDNKPVNFTAATVETETVRLLVKDSTNNAPFKICWGNTLLAPPLYDVNAILAQSKVNPDALPVLHLDTYTENPQYKKPAPALTERYPFLLPLALGIAVLIVGAIQFKSFNKIK